MCIYIYIYVRALGFGLYMSMYFCRCTQRGAGRALSYYTCLRGFGVRAIPAFAVGMLTGDATHTKAPKTQSQSLVSILRHGGFRK